MGLQRVVAAPGVASLGLGVGGAMDFLRCGTFFPSAILPHPAPLPWGGLGGGGGQSCRGGRWLGGALAWEARDGIAPGGLPDTAKSLVVAMIVQTISIPT
jgi:hypothetical protein